MRAKLHKIFDICKFNCFFLVVLVAAGYPIYFLFSIISKGLWLVWFFHCKRVFSIFLFNIFPNELSTHYYTFPNEYSVRLPDFGCFYTNSASYVMSYVASFVSCESSNVMVWKNSWLYERKVVILRRVSEVDETKT